MNGPSDGYAYNRIELTAIWNIEVPTTAIMAAYERAFQFHRHASVLPNNPEAGRDKWAVNRIVRAILAEMHPGLTDETDHDDVTMIVEAIMPDGSTCDLDNWVHVDELPPEVRSLLPDE